MQVLLDDHPCDLDPRTVGEAIGAAAGLARRAGRIVIDVFVDDVHWTDDELSSADRLDGEARVVRMISAEPRRLVADAFADGAEALGDADRLQQEAARLVQSDRQAVALDHLGEALAIWLSVQSTILKGARVVDLDLDSVRVKGRPMTESIAALNDRLVALRNAIDDRDVISLADTLLYEMPGIASEWRLILEELARRVLAAPASG
jgi:hypothetical protein